MRRAGTLGAIGVVLLALSGCVTTEDGYYGPRGGDSLMAIGASYSVLKADDVADTKTVEAEGALGISHFFTDHHEVGALGTVHRQELEFGIVDTDATLYTVSPFYNFNVRSGDRTFFYVGPHAGVQIFDIGSEDDSSFSYGGHVGMRHFASPSTALFIEPRFTRFDLDGDDADEFSILLGLLYRF